MGNQNDDCLFQADAQTAAATDVSQYPLPSSSLSLLVVRKLMHYNINKIFSFCFFCFVLVLGTQPMSGFS